MDKFIFPSVLRQKMASASTQIVSIKNLCKKLSPAYNLLTSSLKAHA